MRCRHGSTVRFLRLVLAGVVVIVAAREGLGRAREAGQALVRVGEYAPDFNLPRLTITSDPGGKPIGVIRDADTFRLSSFRGKRPVCLIMSSYT
jgi:hypothetical protein